MTEYRLLKIWRTEAPLELLEEVNAVIPNSPRVRWRTELAAKSGY